ncbi:MAG: ATP-dependent helicase [Gammaproteobacteria bacterium]|nr:ATP-dependent helicase [Gammaproteobacteria bacterium]
MNIIFSGLNENQRQAVEWDEGSLLVLAGPGSGKTSVLTLRIANLISKSPLENHRILGLTFTVKAANEMQNRLRDLLGENSKRIQLRTFHSFCTDILRQHGSQFNLRPDFEVITNDIDRIAILKELKDQGQAEIDDPENSLKQIDTIFRHGITPHELPRYFGLEKNDQYRKLQSIFIDYTEWLTKENQLDFGSMLYFTRQLLEQVPRIARQVRTVYRYVCVDEFQDTNLAQYKVLRLLCPETTSNLFVVADDDQIIFQWNGANPKRLEELKSDYSPKIVQLPENYRCPTKVVEIANRLIAHNSERIGTKKMSLAQRDNPGNIKLKSFGDFDEEVDGLVSEISRVRKNRRETCLVIARSNKLLTKIQEDMISAGMKAEIVNKSQDFISPPIQMMYYAIKLANAPESRSLLNKLCVATGLVDGQILSAEDVLAQAQVEGVVPLRAFFSKIALSNRLKSVAIHGVTLLCDSLDYMSFAREAISFFDALNQMGEFGEALPDYEHDKENWERISKQIRHTHQNNLSLYSFLQELDLSPKAKTFQKDCVKLQTVHTAKGMESENVFIIGLVEDHFPAYLSIKNGDSAIQEERRNCFVAVTRSSKNLYLSYSRRYFNWIKEPSRFLSEMGLIPN